jgi:hypothetical protein
MAKEAIKQYLDNRAKTDELFAQAYAKPNITGGCKTEIDTTTIKPLKK